ncbi:MAG TPA: hypothetical protein VG097_21090 [Gemmata sp.]|jgi:hypothetical protein|nr:hypothetical protein [Gemmata sp.]
MIERHLHLLSASRMPTSYPLQLSADEVAAWLNGYAAMWHPAALAEASQPPQASVSYDHDNPMTGYIYCTPRGPHLFQPDDWRDRVLKVSAIAFEATPDRKETQQNLLSLLQEHVQKEKPVEANAAFEESTLIEILLDVSDEVVRKFRGLGFGYLLLDNLFEAADHQRLLDVSAFWSDVSAAVQALVKEKTNPGPSEETGEGGSENPPASYRHHLRAAAEKLQTAREQLYSQRMFWVDFAYLTAKKLEATWPESLAAGLPICVAGTGEAFEQLAESAPARFAELKAKILPDLPSAVDLCCGSYCDREDALMPMESQWWNLGAARDAVKKLFGVEPAVYTRKTSAFHPQLPGWLQHMGFKHSILISQDGALIPTIRSTAVNWPGPDGKAVDAFCREPLPAHDPLSFFNLVYHMYQAFGSDSAPTIALVHKGEPAFDSYRDLLALVELAPVFGQFTNLSRYFTDATSGDYIGVQSADEFFTDYLDDRVTNQKRPNPVSGFPQHLRLRRRLDTAYTLASLHRAVTPNPGTDEEKLVEEIHDVEQAIELLGVNLTTQTDLADRLTLVETAWAKRLAERLQTRSASDQPGLLAFNPCGFTRRVVLEINGFGGPIPIVDPVKAAEFSGDLARLVVEIPPLGFAWIPRQGPPGTPLPKERLKLAQGLTVRNEFFECDIDSTGGGIRSFRDLRTRATRFGQQLVYNPGSKMIARNISVTNSGSALGEIVSSGDLLNDRDELLATFKQRYRAWLGRPVLELRIELDVKHEPTGYPWHSFFAARFGWRDERAVLFRGVNGTNAQTGYTRPVSPDYLEVRLGGERSFLFTGGLPFLQRNGSRMADVILVPEGEQARTFELLLATDRDVPMQTATGWVAPVPVVETSKGPPHFGTSGWLAHIDMPSLILTALKPVPPGEGANRAIAARMIECAGFGGAAELRFARDPNRASLIDGMGKALQPLTMLGDAVQVEYSAGETIRVMLEWT